MSMRHWQKAALSLVLVPCMAMASSGAAPPAPPPLDAVLLAPTLRATDLDRSVRFYATALGLVVATTLHHGTQSEVVLCSDGPRRQPVVIMLHDDIPGNNTPLVLGNGFVQIVIRLPDVAGVAARLKAAGYPVGNIQSSGRGPIVLKITDPDGYRYELVQSAPTHG